MNRVHIATSVLIASLGMLISSNEASAISLTIQGSLSGDIEGPISESATNISSSLGVNIGDAITGTYATSFDSSVFDTTDSRVEIPLDSFSLSVGSQTLVPVSSNPIIEPNPLVQFIRSDDSFVFNTLIADLRYSTSNAANIFTQLTGGEDLFGETGEGLLFAARSTGWTSGTQSGGNTVEGGITQTCQGSGCSFRIPPIGDISSQTVSNRLRSGRFGWNSQFDWEFIDQMINIDLDIDLVGEDPGDLINVWEEGIEGIWNSGFNITDGIYTYPIVFNVDFVDGNADQVVTVHSGTGPTDMLNWFLDQPAGWDNTYHDEIAAHEFGHMIGLYDEYEGGAVNPDIDPNVFTNSIMADLGPPQMRHYEDILQLFRSETNRDLSLAFAPVAPYVLDAPIPSFGDTHHPLDLGDMSDSPTSVPEPGSIIALFFLTVYGAIMGRILDSKPRVS